MHCKPIGALAFSFATAGASQPGSLVSVSRLAARRVSEGAKPRPNTLPLKLCSPSATITEMLMRAISRFTRRSSCSGVSTYMSFSGLAAFGMRSHDTLRRFSAERTTRNWLPQRRHRPSREVRMRVVSLHFELLSGSTARRLRIFTFAHSNRGNIRCIITRGFVASSLILPAWSCVSFRSRTCDLTRRPSGPHDIHARRRRRKDSYKGHLTFGRERRVGTLGPPHTHYGL